MDEKTNINNADNQDTLTDIIIEENENSSEAEEAEYSNEAKEVTSGSEAEKTGQIMSQDSGTEESQKNLWTFPNILRMIAAAMAVIVIVFTLLGKMDDQVGTRMLEFGLVCFAIAFFSRKKEE